MIKLDYGDDPKSFADSYAEIFKPLQSDWKQLRKELIKVDGKFEPLLSENIEEFIKLDFAHLIDVYDKFTSVSSMLSKKIIKRCKFLFAYDRYTYRNKSSKCYHSVIANFFMDNAQKMHLDTCHYCDMAYINEYHNNPKKKYNHFDLDHILDKGRCPILALSFYNLVPVCPVCNERLKGQKLIEGTKKERMQLSPTSNEYKFDEKVTIWVNHIGADCSTFEYEKRMDEYEIRFDTTQAPIYKKEVEMFKLVPRYNYHKAEALRLMDLKERYTDSKIIEMARLIMGDDNSHEASPTAVTAINQIKADIFASEFMSSQHRIFGKLHRDIMKK